MDRLKALDEIAEIGQRLAKLRDAHREVSARGDQDLINQVQAETARLMKLKEELMAPPPKPPGMTGRPVRSE